MNNVFFRAGIVLCLLGSTSYALDVHVALTGDDGAAGSAAAPVKTVVRAVQLIDAAGKDGRVLLHGGRYFEPWKIVGPSGVANPAAIVIEPAGDGEVIFDGAVAVANAKVVEGMPGVYRMNSTENWGNPSAFWEQEARTRYVRVLDFEAVRHFPGTWARTSPNEIAFHTSDSGLYENKLLKHNIWPFGNAINRSNVTLRRVHVENHVTGIEVSGAKGVAIEDCVVFNALNGFSVAPDTHNTIFRRCSTRDVAQGVISLGYDTLVEDCMFIKLNDLFTPKAGNPQDDAGIQFYSPAVGGQARRNLIAGFHSGIFAKTSGSFIVEYNTVVGANWGLFKNVWAGSNSRFEHNILLNCTAPLDGVPSSCSPDMIFNHNLIWGTPSQMTHNQYILKTIVDLTGGNKENDIADPKLADPLKHDYRLMPGSPAIAMGKEGKPAGARGVVPDGFVQPVQKAPTVVEPPKYDQPPQFVGAPRVRATANGAVFTFKTDRPCIAQMTNMSAEVAAQLSAPDPALKVRHFYDEQTPVTQHVIAVRRTADGPLKAGNVLRYRIQLQDAIGDPKLTSHEGQITLKGKSRVFYVNSRTGIDTEDRGSADAPLATVQFAADRALGGDTIRIAEGIHHFPTTCKVYSGGLPGAPITFEGAGREKTILDGLKQVPSHFQFDHAPNVIVRGMTLRWFKHAAIYVDNSPHVTIDHCLFINDPWPGVFTTGYAMKFRDSPHGTVTYNIISRVECGVWMHQSPFATIRHNTASGLMYGGLSILWSTEGTVIMDNALAYAGNETAYYHGTTEEKFRAMKVDYNSYAANVLEYASNKRYEKEDPVLWKKMQEEKLTPRHPYYAASKCVISGGIDQPKHSIYERSYRDWLAFSKMDQHSIYADPGWVDPAAGDWRLLPDSPLRNAASDGTHIGAVQERVPQSKRTPTAQR